LNGRKDILMSNSVNRKTKVKVINNTRGSMSFYGCDGRKYLFPKPNSYRTIDLEIIENLYNDYPRMITDGIMLFEDKNIYEYLNISEDEYKKLMPFEAIKDFLELDADTLEDKLKEMPKQMQENVAVTAKEMKIDSKKKNKAIKSATGFDVEEKEDEI
jgi:hypothetical protein